jgi:hypothetical protein
MCRIIPIAGDELTWEVHVDGVEKQQEREASQEEFGKGKGFG